MKVFQVLKLVDRVELEETSSLSSNKLYYFFEFELENDSDINTNHILKSMNKSIEDDEELYEASIKSKHTRIIKSIKMTLTTRYLPKI